MLNRYADEALPCSLGPRSGGVGYPVRNPPSLTVPAEWSPGQENQVQRETSYLVRQRSLSFNPSSILTVIPQGLTGPLLLSRALLVRVGVGGRVLEAEEEIPEPDL